MASVKNNDLLGLPLRNAMVWKPGILGSDVLLITE